MKPFFPRPLQLAALFPFLILAAIGASALTELVTNGPDPKVLKIVVLGTGLGIVLILTGALVRLISREPSTHAGQATISNPPSDSGS